MAAEDFNLTNLETSDEQDYLFHNFQYEDITEAPYTVSSILVFVEEEISEIIKIILSITSSAAAILLLYVIMRFNRLKSAPGTGYLLQFSVCSILTYAVFPVISLALDNILTGEILDSAHFHFYCILFRTDRWLRAVVLYFAVAMAIFYYHSDGRGGKFETYSLVVVYFIAISDYFWMVSECFALQNVSSHFFIVIYVAMVTVVVTIDFKTRGQAKTDRYQLLVAKVIVYSFLPAILTTRLFYYGFSYVDSVPKAIASAANIIYFCTQFVVYAIPVSVVFAVRSGDERFRLAIDRVLTCGRTSEDGGMRLEDEESMIGGDDHVVDVPAGGDLSSAIDI